MHHSTMRLETEAVRRDYNLSVHAGLWICTYALCQFGEDFGSTLEQSPFFRAFQASPRVVPGLKYA